MKPQFSIIGFDRLFEQFDRQMRLESGPKYPPHDLVRIGDKYEIRLAVAGFDRDEISVELEAKVLRIKGAKIKKVGEDDSHEETYIFNGISQRSFDRQFVLSDTVIVKDVTLVNGILTVKMEEYIPEEMKPKKFTVN